MYYGRCGYRGKLKGDGEKSCGKRDMRSRLRLGRAWWRRNGRKASVPGTALSKGNGMQATHGINNFLGAMIKK